jgi:hypothetical protein
VAREHFENEVKRIVEVRADEALSPFERNYLLQGEKLYTILAAFSTYMSCYTNISCFLSCLYYRMLNILTSCVILLQLYTILVERATV